MKSVRFKKVFVPLLGLAGLVPFFWSAPLVSLDKTAWYGSDLVSVSGTSLWNWTTETIKKTSLILDVVQTTVQATAAIATARCPVPADQDTDGDAIPDCWEMLPIDINTDGITDLDLTLLRANPFHKDIFVEVDYMPKNKPMEGH